MIIECDISIVVKNIEESDYCAIKESLPEFFLVDRKGRDMTISDDILLADSWDCYNKKLGSFLKYLLPERDKIAHLESTVRFGFYYRVSETVVFRFAVSSENIALMSTLGFSMDYSGYPCNDEE